MNSRSFDDFDHERQALDAAHAQNEAGRDAFIALAHTALFASSIAFVGDVAPITTAIWQPALILGWIADVVGLLALTFSFGAARRAIDARRAALNDLDPPDARLCEWLNAAALWSFPVALLCLFSFATANVIHANDRQEKPTAPTAHSRDIYINPRHDPATQSAGGDSSSTAELRTTGGIASPEGTEPQRRASPMDRRNSSPESANTTASATSPAAEEVNGIAWTKALVAPGAAPRFHCSLLLPQCVTASRSSPKSAEPSGPNIRYTKAGKNGER